MKMRPMNPKTLKIPGVAVLVFCSIVFNAHVAAAQEIVPDGRSVENRFASWLDTTSLLDPFGGAQDTPFWAGKGGAAQGQTRTRFNLQVGVGRGVDEREWWELTGSNSRHGIAKLNHFGLPLRGPESKILRMLNGDEKKHDAKLFSDAVEDLGMRGTHKKWIDLTYRKVEYVYAEDGSTPAGIVEIVQDGKEVRIAEICVKGMVYWNEYGESHAGHQLVDVSTPEERKAGIVRFQTEHTHGEAVPSTLDDIPVYVPEGTKAVTVDGIEVTRAPEVPAYREPSIGCATTVRYIDEDGFDVIVTFAGMPVWTNLLVSASVHEGVFYGIEAGGMVTKAHNEYDRSGRKVCGLMKTVRFDREGKPTGTEVTRESFQYNAKGDLIYGTTVREADGKLASVRWSSYLYARDGKLFMKILNELHYATDGTVISSTQEQTAFDSEGREIRYTLVIYEKGQMSRTIKRVTAYNEKGDVIYYLNEEVVCDGDGNERYSTRLKKAVRFVAVGGEYVKEEMEEYAYKSGTWASTETRMRRFDGVGRLVYDYLCQKNEEYAYERIESLSFRDETGGYSHSVTAAAYGKDGAVLWRTREEEEFTYDDNGKPLKNRSFNQRQQTFRGELVTVYEIETTTEYEYDADGDITKEHEYGYWFSTYVDPYFDNRKTLLYGIVNGAKKLLRLHSSRVSAQDKGFTRLEYSEEFDCVYTYDKKTGNIVREYGNSRKENYDQAGALYYKSTIEHDYTYGYDGATGKVVNEKKTIVETHDWLPQGTASRSVTNEDTVYAYDAATKALTGVDKAVSYTYSSTYDLNPESYYTFTRETRIQELYADGNPVSKSTVEVCNGQMNFVELVSFAYYENGQEETMSRHSERSWDGIVYSSEDEVMQHNAQGKVLLHSIESTDGKIYHEKRTYGEDGTTLLTRDVVSEDPYRFIILHHVDREIGELSGAQEAKSVMADLAPLYPKAGAGRYELHERYLPDGKCAYREEKSEDGGAWRWGGPRSSQSIEKWDYTESGTLTHYEKEYSVRYSPWRFFWLSDAGSAGTSDDGTMAASVNGSIVMLPPIDKYPGYGTVDYTLKIERDYDSATGRLLREEYSLKGYQGARGGWEVLAKEITDGRKDIPGIPEDLTSLINGITNYFSSLGSDYGYRYTDQKMAIEHGDGTTSIKCVVNDSEGKMLSAFFGTITHDKNGKIKAFTLSYAGEGQERWQAMIEGLKGLFPDIDFGIAGKTENATEAPYTATKGEIDARLAAEAACRSQAEGLTREMEKRKDLYETLAQ